MKIFCIGRNYADHAKELNNPVPKNPLVFMKPTTALLIKNRHFFYPELSNDIHYEGEVVLKIGKNGRHVQPEFALSYIDGIGFGLDLTARDIQKNVKKKDIHGRSQKALTIPLLYLNLFHLKEWIRTT